MYIYYNHFIMARVDNSDYTKKHGKMNRKDNVIHRVRNGKEHVYSILDPYQGPATEAQQSNRSNFGKISAIVNRIIADPIQKAEWQQRFDDFNRAFVFTRERTQRPYKTLHQYVYAVIRQQIEQSPSPATQLPKGVSLHIRTFSALSASEIYEILKARYAVFTEEQHIIYLDEDDIDYLATHIYLTRGPRVIAYARLFPDKPDKFLNTATYDMENTPQAFLFGRMLTLERGQGLGTRLMHSIVAEAKRQGAQILRLHAQTQAVPFYEKFGFQTVGDVFEEADIPHILMEKPL